MKKLVMVIAVTLSVGFTVTSCKSKKEDSKKVETEVVKEVENVKNDIEKTNQKKEMALATYQCPVKCEGDKTYNKKGQCPICKMDLVKVKSGGATEEHEHEVEGAQEQ